MRNLNKRYRLLGLIGKGQFGEVYCGIHIDSGSVVALKKLDTKTFPTRKFLREFSFLVSLEHLHIVNCQGLEHYQQQRYLVLDYCEGGTLRDIIDSKHQINIIKKIQIIIDVLEGLTYAHQKSIIHCDLKPENILLNLIPGGWQAKISDFGIAKLAQESENSANLGYTGSPAYMAPERFYGKHSPASDIYAMGIILYELITGKRLYFGTPKEVMNGHLNQVVSIPSEIPYILRSTLAKSLQKLPQSRFKDAAEMLKSVRLAMEVLIATEPSSIWTRNSSISTDSVAIPPAQEYKYINQITSITLEDVKAAAYSLKWFVIAYADTWEIYQVPSLSLRRLPRLPPQEFIIVDDEHALALYSHADGSTFIYFTRRGNLLGEFSTPLHLYDIFCTKSYQLQARERGENNSLLLIDLLPLKMRRQPLTIVTMYK